jgi:hypothetical protein
MTGPDLTFFFFFFFNNLSIACIKNPVSTLTWFNHKMKGAMLLSGLANACTKTLKKQKGFERFPSQRKRMVLWQARLN